VAPPRSIDLGPRDDDEDGLALALSVAKLPGRQSAHRGRGRRLSGVATCRGHLGAASPHCPHKLLLGFPDDDLLLD